MAGATAAERATAAAAVHAFMDGGYEYEGEAAKGLLG